MGRYLNSQTRRDVVIMVGMVSELNDIRARWANNMKNPPEKVLKLMRTASSFISSTTNTLARELDKKEIEQLYKIAGTTTFDIGYTKFNGVSRAPGVVTYDITEDERDNIVEALVEVRCKGCDGFVPNCKVRTQFFKWEIAPVHEIIDNNHPCQYMDLDEGGV